MSDPIDQFMGCVESATMSRCTVLAPDVLLDATVPNWRLAIRGDDAVRAELGRWYDTPGRFEDVERRVVADGEVVEFVRTWQEAGTPFAVHQVHVLKVDDGRIVADRAWCGGRWSAAQLAEMEEARA